MNSLNILSSHVSPPPSSPPSRSNSMSAIALLTSEADRAGSGRDRSTSTSTSSHNNSNNSNSHCPDGNSYSMAGTTAASETTPLLSHAAKDADGCVTGSAVRLSKWRSLPKHLAVTVWQSIRWILQTLTAPGVYLFAFMYDEEGNWAPLGPLRALFVRPHSSSPGGGLHGKFPDAYLHDPEPDYVRDFEKSRRLSTESKDSMNTWSASLRPLAETSIPEVSYSSYAVSTESESEFDRRGSAGSVVLGIRRKGTNESTSASTGAGSGAGAPRRGTGGSASRAGDGMDDDDGSTTGTTSGGRRSVRIKLNDDSLKKRKHRRGTASMRGGSSSVSFSDSTGGDPITKDISTQLKSPTSPAGALTKYPRTPAPPRPLVPRRQPSYLNLEPTDRAHQKTLILDLDETLIHSMSKGGRMSTGHMVEVRLNTTFVGMGGQPSLGPQHPILYYVHKRPYCDEFLRRVYKWYNLVVFTASVQEYADPVIDWLESERKFFSARYYRQHCTFRHGAFIKDLSAVEPDLSKVMILDNSPLSYMFHQDNAIPIQGWISDHTDNDLLHLVPLLEGLQYVSDVRALLALRGGEQGRHMA